MENYQTPISDRIIKWLTYGSLEHYKKPLEATLKNPTERTKRFEEILKMK